jgi:DNA ligase-1
MLANVYPADEKFDLDDYWVSEKLDGVRAYWDGAKLLTRAGNLIRTPPWFTAGWPNVPLDGELWAGRGRFEHASSTVRRHTPDENAWRQMRFMVFDLPAHRGPFTERLAALTDLQGHLASSWVQLVAQFHVSSHSALQDKLHEIAAQGGEGVMLHRGASGYRAQRSDDLLKYKLYEDAEAQVIGYEPGNGKYQGMVGALRVRRRDGIQFHIGAGLTDAQRRTPPPLGSWVTYAYNGLTATGIPRFARLVRITAP